MIKLAIAEDHNVLRTALVNLLNDNSDFSVIIDVPNGQELLVRMSDQNLPDLILIDVEMPILDGPTTVKKVREVYGEKVKIIGLSVHRELRLVQEMLESGANGYVSKAANHDELFSAIHKVMKFEFYLSSDISHYINTADLPENKDMSLTETEEAILKLICNQHTNQEIADALGVSRNTVNTYRTRMIAKLRVKNSIGLVLYAIKNGLHRLK